MSFGEQDSLDVTERETNVNSHHYYGDGSTGISLRTFRRFQFLEFCAMLHE
jgi:hypothetical protein